MNKRVILPFDENPITCCYPYITFPYSIINGNISQLSGFWLCNEYINCIYRESLSNNRFVITENDSWFRDKKYIDFEMMKILKSMPDKLGIDLKYIFKKAMDAGRYPNGHCSGRIIFDDGDVDSSSRFEYILTGYDDCKNIFFMRGFKSGKLIYKEIDCDRFVNALYIKSEINIIVYMWKYNSDIYFSVNTDQIKSELNGYINSRASVGISQPNVIYGINAIKKLVNYFLFDKSEDFMRNERYLRNLKEHKTLMYKRIKFMFEQEIIMNKKLIDDYREIIYFADDVLKCGIDYCREEREDIKEQFTEKINTMLYREREILQNILQCIN